MICITGSNGKTTTTSLIYHIFKKAGLNVGLAGNIGQSLAFQVAEYNYDYYVIELSSFQLDNMYKFHANIAVLMNITPDHLDRYDHKMQNYVDAKFRIIQNQTDEDAFIFGMMIRLFSVSYINMEFTDTTIPLPSKKKKEQQPMLRKTRYASPNRLLSIWNKKSWP